MEFKIGEFSLGLLLYQAVMLLLLLLLLVLCFKLCVYINLKIKYLKKEKEL